MSVSFSSVAEEHAPATQDAMASGSVIRLIWRAIRLRCPDCGGRGLFDRRFRLNRNCASCGLLLERGESDYFLGAYLFNLIAVELMLAAVLGAIAIATWPDTPWTALQWGGVLLAAVLAVVCYPFAKSFWLAFDMWLRPVTAAERDVAAGAPREIAGELV
jgi:uncharacterized protein (DUF983 family)